MDGAVTTRRITGVLICLVAAVLGIGIGLSCWSIPYPHVSTWQYRIVGFIWLLCMLFIFEAIARSGRVGKWIALGMLGIGGLLNAVLIGFFLYAASPWGKGHCFVAVRGGAAIDPYVLISPFTWFLAIGCYSVLQRWIRKTLAIRSARLRLSSPVLGVLLFLAVYSGLCMYSTWANSVAYHHQSMLPFAFGIGQIFLPALYLTAYVLLTAQTLRARTRAFEWAITGVVLGLAFTIPQYYSIHGMRDWLGDAGPAMAAIGLMALLVSFFPRRGITEIS